MRKCFVSLALSFLLAGCASTAQDSSAAAKAAIDRKNASAEQWYAAGDVQSVAAIFAEDAWQMAPNQPPLIGRNAIRAFWQQAFQWGTWKFSLHAEDVHANGPVAVERGKYVLNFTPGAKAPPGMAGFTDRGNYVVHWRHEADGEWRAVWDAPVSELPFPPPPK